jgi:uncharacterized protein YciI
VQRYAYFYFMKPDPVRVRLVASKHAAYWHELQLADYAGGPFADRSGGLITFAADDDSQAQRTVESDPFMVERLIEAHWLKAWTPTTD